MSSVRYSLLWSTSHCKKLVRKKKKLYQKAKKSKLRIGWNKYRSAATESRKTCRHAYNVFIKNCLYENNNSNPKRLYSCIKNKQVDNFGEGPLKDNDKVCIEDKDKARISNSQFPSVFSTDNRDIPLIETQYANSSISNIDINTEGIIKLLNQLYPNNASGPDNISARLLKETSLEKAPGLALIFQASLCQGDWRKANVTPSYKQGKKDWGKAENYWPISLTSISCKILEHIIHSNVMNYLCTNNILSDVQHGFRKSRSREAQLITLVNDLAKSPNDGGQLDAALLDFSKAFDKVNHRKLS